uniref:RNA polymerase II-associated factor 1 homolog n=1 Tax=Macrostomum lignano TaxID=282301 RepID=A0A1I8FER7_9PLAT
ALLPAPSSASSGGQASQRKQESGLICRVRYCNSLPDIPFDPKFLAYPFETGRFVKYKYDLKEYKHELLTELDLGIDIDLVNPDTYQTSLVAKPDPEDEALFADETGPGGLHQRAIISNEANRQNQVFSDKIESKINLKNKVFSEAEDIYKTKEKQIEAIEKTFEATKRPVEEHYSRRGVHAVQVMPLLPDFQLWQHPCAQVIFDTDPTPKDQSGLSDDVTQAMIRGMVDESGDQFLTSCHFLPTRETRAKRKRDQEAGLPYVAEDVYEYELNREYNWNVKNKSMKGYDENYFFVFREGGVYYNELETRVRLSKRRKIGMPGGAPTTKTKLVVRHRDFNPAELADRTARLAALEPAERRLRKTMMMKKKKRERLRTMMKKRRRSLWKRGPMKRKRIYRLLTNKTIRSSLQQTMKRKQSQPVRLVLAEQSSRSWQCSWLASSTSITDEVTDSQPVVKRQKLIGRKGANDPLSLIKKSANSTVKLHWLPTVEDGDHQAALATVLVDEILPASNSPLTRAELMPMLIKNSTADTVQDELVDSSLEACLLFSCEQLRLGKTSLSKPLIIVACLRVERLLAASSSSRHRLGDDPADWPTSRGVWCRRLAHLVQLDWGLTDRSVQPVPASSGRENLMLFFDQ